MLSRKADGLAHTPFTVSLEVWQIAIISLAEQGAASQCYLRQCQLEAEGRYEDPSWQSVNLMYRIHSDIAMKLRLQLTDAEYDAGILAARKLGYA